MKNLPTHPHNCIIFNTFISHISLLLKLQSNGRKNIRRGHMLSEKKPLSERKRGATLHQQKPWKHKVTPIAHRTSGRWTLLMSGLTGWTCKLKIRRTYSHKWERLCRRTSTAESKDNFLLQLSQKYSNAFFVFCVLFDETSCSNWKKEMM